MINAKITKAAPKENTEEKLFKILESIDWKLWEMYNIMKDNVPSKPAVKTQKKSKADEE
jgi:hypothetical protein